MEKRTSKELAKNEHPSDVVLFLLFIHRAFLQDWYWYPCWLVSGLFAFYVHHDKRVSVWKFWCLVMYRCAWLELILKPAIYSIYAVSIFCWNCWDIWDRIESVISENIEIFLKYDRYIADRDCAVLPPADGNYREGKQKSNKNQFKMMIDFDCLECWCGLNPPQKKVWCSKLDLLEVFLSQGAQDETQFGPLSFTHEVFIIISDDDGSLHQL